VSDDRVAIGCDHRGVALKDALKAVLESLGKTVEDMGAFSDDAVDYPDIAKKVARSVSGREADRGILICGSGIGMSVTAKKFRGVRAALCHDLHTARMSRLHNDANILAIGETVVGRELAEQMVKTWFATPFEGGRHQRRLDRIQEVEKENF